MKVGIGYDIHKLARGRKLLLGGALIPHPTGLLGHSDGDVLLHAVIDAILGAMGLGDIGEWFSPDRPELKGISSAVMAAQVLKEAKKQGYRIGNVDTVVIAEKPKLGPHKLRIKKSLARILGCSASQVAVKAKTMEGIGEIGKGRAIAATCVVLLENTR